jgi:UDP-N-acetylmuramoyl-tripeptide--D-alanyl-D-alanine ligase
MAASMMLTAAVIATATGGTLHTGDPKTVINGISIDSRTLRTGDLFFAIVAARDGHDFIEAALERGAAGVVVSVRRPALEGGAVVIQVPDTTLALQDLGRFIRRASGTQVIAITGSAGKTTTKETIAEFLSGHFRVARSVGNLNNHLGLPLSLAELRHGADIAVMELGMNRPGEIRLLVRIAEPNVRVWTNVGDAHLGHFASRDEIADAKGEILEGATAADVLVCNADDPLVTARTGDFVGRTIRFGLSPAADVRADAVQDLGLDGTKLKLHIGAEAIDVHTPLLGRGNLSNLLAAAAAAASFGVPIAEIAAKAANLKPASHRGAVLRLPRGVIVLDDSYNSSPAALKRALEVVAGEKRVRRKAAVLGEMLELGDHSVALHESCGEAAAGAGLDRLIVVGGEPAVALANAAIRAGMSEDAVSLTQSSSGAADLIIPWLADGDLVLVKGSRGIKTETVVQRITEAFS